MKNKTAVQWLEEQLYKSGWDKLTHVEKLNICATAKLMEREQIENAYKEGQDDGWDPEYGYDNIFKNSEQYYKDTFL